MSVVNVLYGHRLPFPFKFQIRVRQMADYIPECRISILHRRVGALASVSSTGRDDPHNIHNTHDFHSLPRL
jgi:hypothetical protein